MSVLQSYCTQPDLKEISRYLATILTTTWRAAADPELCGCGFFSSNTLCLLPSHLTASAKFVCMFFISVTAVSTGKYGAPSSYPGNQPLMWWTTSFPSFSKKRCYNIYTFPSLHHPAYFPYKQTEPEMPVRS